jgi:hypothetical protein
MLRRRIESKIEDVFREYQFGFRRGEVTMHAFWMLGIKSESTLEMYEGLCACFKDWQKAF